MLKLHNSLTQQKEIFKPNQPGKINLYVCGITVYDYCHIGHARMLVAFDMITRYLRDRGYDVYYVKNITDIDDKIIKRANENGETYLALTDRMIAAMYEDLQALNILPPNKEPRATEYIPQMIAMIEQLIAKDYAYVAANGDVCYKVNHFESYGELAHQKLEDLRSGARVEVETSKCDPLDFVLWKLAKPDEPFWPSPWGNGRPGWHIECSAMSLQCLGENFDIHGGGLDLLFPHHQNEIAQSEGVTGKKFVNYWLHNGFVQVDKEKMSKSLGNFFTIRDALKQFSGEIIRYFLLASHYRSPVNYTEENLQSARSALERFYISLRDLSLDNQSAPINLLEDQNPYLLRFVEAMDDDFNTPEALAVLFDMARDINRLREENLQEAIRLGSYLRQLGKILGILQQNPNDFLQAGTDQSEAAKIEELIAARNQARKDKNYAEADRIRKELLDAGITLEDVVTGTIWRKA